MQDTSRLWHGSGATGPKGSQGPLAGCRAGRLTGAASSTQDRRCKKKDQEEEKEKDAIRIARART